MPCYMNGGPIAVQLRDLVPPQSHNSAVQDSQDSKRPKHVVLSDTIALVRELQSKVRLPFCCQSRGSQVLFCATLTDTALRQCTAHVSCAV